MGIRSATEVFGLFAAVIPQAAHEELDTLPRRKRQGLVPDMSVTCSLHGAPERAHLVEIKTLHVGSSTYPNLNDRCEAVQRRARAIPCEYLAKARQLDQQFCRTPVGSQGPVELRLRTLADNQNNSASRQGSTMCSVVFGAFGEASSDVEG